MGAKSFFEVGAGGDLSQAFWNAATAASRQFEFDSYTGTISEKYKAQEFAPPEQIKAVEFACDLESACWRMPFDGTKYVDSAFWSALDCYSDKWGPAVAIPVCAEVWIICGLASF